MHGVSSRPATRYYSAAGPLALVPTWAQWSHYVRDAGERLAKAIAEVLGTRTDVAVTQTVVGDRAAKALVQSARGAQMLVVGSSGQGELPGMHIGSTTNYCVHHAPCPVMVLRTQVL